MILNKNNISITAKCDFGLGNRLYTLIGALYIAKKLNITQVNVIWLPSNECDCSFFDLFSSFKDITFLNNDSQYYDINIRCGFGFNEPGYLALTAQHRFINNIKKTTYKNLLSKYKVNIVYTSVTIPEEIELEFIVDVFRKLKINKKILKRAQKFINANNITKNTLGFHFRKTDKTIFFNQYALDLYNQHLYFIHNNKSDRIFIASDDKNIHTILSIYKNTLSMPLRRYPLFFSNTNQIIRNKSSVLDSLCTMLVLSRTTLLNYEMVGASSFLGCAYYLSFINTETLFKK
jgi:hypothetical protein